MATPSVPRRPVTRVASARPPGYFDRSQPVALRSEETRAEFITRTYLHLFGAVLAFTLLEMAYSPASPCAHRDGSSAPPGCSCWAASWW
jgi:hypothetical protein